jgi:ribonuclease VapC
VSRIVLDTSALLAILNGEPGAEMFNQTSDLLEEAAMSSVNVAPVPEILDFDTNQAKIAGSLLPYTRPLGLSLGDRACLALGIALKAPIYTADRAWKSLKLKVAIHVIR